MAVASFHFTFHQAQTGRADYAWAPGSGQIWSALGEGGCRAVRNRFKTGSRRRRMPIPLDLSIDQSIDHRRPVVDPVYEVTKETSRRNSTVNVRGRKCAAKKNRMGLVGRRYEFYVTRRTCFGVQRGFASTLFTSLRRPCGQSPKDLAAPLGTRPGAPTPGRGRNPGPGSRKRPPGGPARPAPAPPARWGRSRRRSNKRSPHSMRWDFFSSVRKSSRAVTRRQGGPPWRPSRRRPPRRRRGWRGACAAPRRATSRPRSPRATRAGSRSCARSASCAWAAPSLPRDPSLPLPGQARAGVNGGAAG